MVMVAAVVAEDLEGDQSKDNDEAVLPRPVDNSSGHPHQDLSSRQLLWSSSPRCRPASSLSLLWSPSRSSATMAATITMQLAIHTMAVIQARATTTPTAEMAETL